MKRLFFVLSSVVLFTIACSASPDSETAADQTSSRPIASLGEMCGGIAAIQCGAGHFCQMEDYACMEVADAAGVCAGKPDFCTEQFEPVCGCDGQTYSNGCKAFAAGTSIAADGPCNEADG